MLLPFENWTKKCLVMDDSGLGWPVQLSHFGPFDYQTSPVFECSLYLEYVLNSFDLIEKSKLDKWNPSVNVSSFLSILLAQPREMVSTRNYWGDPNSGFWTVILSLNQAFEFRAIQELDGKNRTTILKNLNGALVSLVTHPEIGWSKSHFFCLISGLTERHRPVWRICPAFEWSSHLKTGQEIVRNTNVSGIQNSDPHCMSFLEFLPTHNKKNITFPGLRFTHSKTLLF
jgi:hypothetical protein